MSNLEDINILTEWDLTTRTHNALKDNGILKLSELLEWPEKKFLTIPGFGKKGLEEIKNHLDRYNLKLGSDFQLIENENKQPIKVNEIKSLNIKKEKLDLDILSINILEDWPLSARTFNALKSENIYLLGDLISQEEKYLLKLRNFGKKSLSEITDLFQKYKINKNYLYENFNLNEWLEHKETVNKIKKNENLNIENISVKSLLKDYNKFQQEYFQKKIKINFDSTNEEIENLIINDLEKILSNLKDKMVFLFKGRYGYDEKYKTLEEIGSELDVTRERIRQIESKLNTALPKLSSIEIPSLLKFLNKFDYISFHKIFPNLNKKFSKTALGVKDTENNKLTDFIENYCGVDQNYFRTPERELWNFNSLKLTQIFKLIESGISLGEFTEIIKDYYGYKDFVARSAIDFMEKNKLILLKENKVFALKMTKNVEVVHILNSYPEGLHWKKIAEIGNQSYTNNKWDLDRVVGDHSLNMISNNDIYLIDRGSYKLLKYCPELYRKNKIINAFVEYLKKIQKDQVAMEIAFNEIIQNDEFKNLSFYDARAIIKNFGAEHRIYHKGVSGTNTLGFNKDLKTISLKDKIKEIIDNSGSEIHFDEIKKKLLKRDEDLPLETHLNDLINNLYIFRISPGTYLNYNDAINLCDKNKVFDVIDELLNQYQFLTIGFVREKINNTLEYNLSSFYYASLIKILAEEQDWFISKSNFSKKIKDEINLDKFVFEEFSKELSIDENFKIFSQKIGILKSNYIKILSQINNNG